MAHSGVGMKQEKRKKQKVVFLRSASVGACDDLNDNVVQLDGEVELLHFDHRQRQLHSGGICVDHLKSKDLHIT